MLILQVLYIIFMSGFPMFALMGEYLVLRRLGRKALEDKNWEDFYLSLACFCFGNLMLIALFFLMAQAPILDGLHN